MKTIFQTFLVLCLLAITSAAQTITTYSTNTAVHLVDASGVVGHMVIGSSRYVTAVTFANTASVAVNAALFDVRNPRIITTNTVNVASQVVLSKAYSGGTGPFGGSPVTGGGNEGVIETSFTATAIPLDRPRIAFAVVPAGLSTTMTFNPPIQVSGLTFTNTVPTSGAITYTISSLAYP